MGSHSSNPFEQAQSPRSPSQSNVRSIGSQINQLSPTSSIDLAHYKNNETKTGPEGFLASLHHEACESSAPQSSTKRATFNGRKSAFFNSVKSVLRKNSVRGVTTVNARHPQTQQALARSQEQAQPLNQRRDSFTMLGAGSQVPTLTRLSSSEGQATVHHGTAAHPPLPSPVHPLQSQDQCSFYAGVIQGVFSQALEWTGTRHKGQDLEVPGRKSEHQDGESLVDEKYIEKWSESDDPLSPASFQEVMPGIFLGSAKSALNIDRLIQHRITHILTVMNRPLNVLARPG